MAANEQVRRSGALTRVAVLDAGERLFAARGYRGTSLEEIGREAGLSRGTPGYFFGSKQRLYGEVLDRILTRAQATLASASVRSQDTSMPLPELLEEIVTAHLGVLTADPTLVRLIQWETLEGQGQILGAIGAQARAFVELIQRLAAASGVGELDETTATELLVCATAMCWFPLAHADALERTFHRDPRSPEAVAAQAKTIVEFVLMRLATLRSTSPA
jgi:TetR/AcrR family transcriptional regulator